MSYTSPHPLFLGLVALFACACSSSSPMLTPESVAPESRDVAFQSGDLEIVGTLTLPEREAGKAVPALILMAGSGASDRNEVLTGQLGMAFGFEIPTFRQIAEGLQAAGVAVLRYDKRSCGRFNGCAENDYPVPSDAITVDVFEQDAEAGLDYLEGLADIDKSRISVAGHSEGGTYVIPILTRRAELRSGIMLSAPFKPIDAIVHDQTEFVRFLLQQTGVSEARVDNALMPLLQIDNAVAAMRAGTFSGGAVAGAYPAFWLSLMALGDINPKLSHDLDRPILALGGSYDWNVPVSELSAWKENFSASVHPETRETRVLECMTHALNCVTQPDYTQLQPKDIGRTIDPDLVPALAAFINAY